MAADVEQVIPAFLGAAYPADMIGILLKNNNALPGIPGEEISRRQPSRSRSQNQDVMDSPVFLRRIADHSTSQYRCHPDGNPRFRRT
jgi:hypothetical protein